ncbi:rCG28004 [Rattus norvegicus]|uniref:RCG28004 n=1 Tax=Rattus norvegicus TaxID=10116 RepID=A6IEQ4_RAT|nr:rCG28004 [Rattus norvegicus]
MHSREMVRTQKIMVLGATSYNSIGAEGMGGPFQITLLMTRKTREPFHKASSIKKFVEVPGVSVSTCRSHFR